MAIRNKLREVEARLHSEISDVARRCGCGSVNRIDDSLRAHFLRTPQAHALSDMQRAFVVAGILGRTNPRRPEYFRLGARLRKHFGSAISGL